MVAKSFKGEKCSLIAISILFALLYLLKLWSCLAASEAVIFNAASSPCSSRCLGVHSKALDSFTLESCGSQIDLKGFFE